MPLLVMCDGVYDQLGACTPSSVECVDDNAQSVLMLQGPAETPEKVDDSSVEVDDADVPDAIAAIIDDVSVEDSNADEDDDNDD